MPPFGSPHRHFRATDSTNARARELAEAGAPGGLVITADEQSAGRGRQGRSWFGSRGGTLLYSALLRPLGERPLLPLAAPLAICAAAESLAEVRCEVKWPNDVWIEGRKVAGVLIESRASSAGRSRSDAGWAVIGVGLNLAVAPDQFPPELRETATSLSSGSTGAGPDPRAALAALNSELGFWTDAEPEAILAEFRRRDALKGREISWEGGSGTAAGIDDSGHLLVTTGDAQVALGAGEVHLSLG